MHLLGVRGWVRWLLAAVIAAGGSDLACSGNGSSGAHPGGVDGGGGSLASTSGATSSSGAPSSSSTTGGDAAAGSGLVAQPATYDFVSVAVGSMATATFTITNTGGPVTLGDWSHASITPPFSFAQGTCASGATIAASASCTVSVTFAPTAMGADSATVTLPYTGAGGAALSVVLLVQGSAPDSVCTGAGSTYSSIGSGTVGDPYVLCSAAQLASLSSTPSAWKQAYRMGADIDLSGTTFSPIGTTANPFHGTFDGAGHTISNLTLSLPNQDYVGFFGSVLGPASEIRSLTIIGANVSGGSNTGILAGSVDRGRVIDCATAGTVQGMNGVGGVVGSAYYAGTISSSHSSATVTAQADVGGLAGSAQEGAYVASSYATGAVSGNTAVGGLIGSNHASTIRNSYATGNVTGTGTSADQIGGLLGGACSLVQHCFSTGNVQVASSTGPGVAPFIGFWPCGSGEGNFELQGSTCTISTGPCKADTGSALTAATTSALQNTSALPLSAWDFQATWVASAGAFPTLAPALWNATTWSGCAANASSPHVATGSGTAEQPYVICSAAQFASLGGDNPWWASSSSNTTAVLYIVQMADIDLTGVSLAPIGTNVPFEGVYDGEGYKLSNFTISSSAAQVGLFGDANNAHIARVAAVGGNVTATSTSATSAGIIVGGDFGTINDSYATGTITGPTHVGGVSGGTHDVLNCYSVASVTATKGQAAGLDGTGGTDITASDSFAASNVTAASGGDYLVAQSSSNLVIDCFYDGSKTCSGCSSMLGTAISSPSYLYSDANPPMTKWDFDNVWTQVASSYPDLR